MPKSVTLGLIAAALLAVACGGDGESTTATSTPAPRITEAPSATAAATLTSTAVSPSATAEAVPPTPAPPTAAPATQPPAPTTAPPPAPSPVSSGPPPPVRFDVRAANLAFDRTELRARSGAQVTAAFQNNDAGVPHNLSFSVPGLDHGETCTGPCSTTQTFTAPAPGRYQFFCTIHPMVGDFIVDP